jgi:crotonobetainyl-CoA:carnitine CoA-transferase CaiB-like acyl-CoA transferase
MPVVPGIYVSDAGSGLMAAIAILSAIIARRNTNKGRFIDVAMLDSAMSILSTVSGFLRPDGEPAQSETLGMKMPGYNVYETKDGKYIALGIFRPQSWETLCRFFERDDLINQHWAIGQAQEKIFSFFKEKFLAKTRDEWCQVLRGLDIEIGPVNDLKEVYDDPQVLHRQMAVQVDHPGAGKIKQIGIPIKLSDTPEPVIMPAPSIGCDTEEILKELNYTELQIQELRIAKAI